MVLPGLPPRSQMEDEQPEEPGGVETDGAARTAAEEPAEDEQPEESGGEETDDGIEHLDKEISLEDDGVSEPDSGVEKK